MRKKTKDLISDLILDEIKTCHDTRYAIRKIIREEILSIRELIGLEYNNYYARGYGESFDSTPEYDGRNKINYMVGEIKDFEELFKKIKDLFKQELKIDIDKYVYETETKLVKKTKDIK